MSLTKDRKKTIQAAAYQLALSGQEQLIEMLLNIIRPRPAVMVNKSTGKTAAEAVEAAMDRGATHIRRLVRPGGSGLFLAEFETRPGCEPVRFPGEG